MGWTEELPNGKFRACWRDSHGKKRSKSGFTQKPAALRHAGDEETKARNGAGPTDGRPITWGKWCEEWLALRRVKPSTAVEDKLRVEKHIRPQWGKVQLRRITRAAVQTWINDMERSGITSGTVRRIYYTFSASMKDALIYGRVGANPCTHIALPDPAIGTERYYTREEFEKTLWFLDEPWHTVAIVLVGTGLRFAELAGLHEDRVDLKNRILTVAETWDADRSEIVPPKSGRERYVPIPDFVIEEIGPYVEMARASSGGCGYRHRNTKAKCRSGLVFLHGGSPLDGKNMLRRHWKPALDLAGVAPGRVHDLRHTYASWLRQSGVDLQVVQQLLGHASVVTTSKYSHFGSTAHETVRVAMDPEATTAIE